MHAVTIAARNYLPFARLLARSFLEHNATSSFTILVVDALPDEVPEADGYRIATAADLPLDPEEFRRMAMIYDVTELCTALKPSALMMLLAQGVQVAVYLDPDIIVYDDLAEVESQSRRHGIVLTPHTLSPMKRDRLLPSEADIMGSGVYNLGFIAVGPRSVAMLEWWQERLLRDSISAPELNLFTDQRWIDFVPSFFDHVILRDPGYNVAYWNLDSRPLERRGDGVLVDGRPLRFFHFSGYRPEKPWVLSKYVADRPRVLLSAQPIVQELCEAYGAAAIGEGIAAAAASPYRFDKLTNGVRVTRAMRRIYRLALIEADVGAGDSPPAPFATAGDDAVLAWFRAPAQPGHSLNRAIYGTWQVRPDIRAFFPQPLGADESALLAWARVSALAEGELVPELLPGPADVAPSAWQTSDEPGVNVSGYLTAELGMGQCGRLVVEAVRATGLSYSTTTWTRTLSRTQESFEDVDDGVRYPVNVAMVNADQIPTWAQEVGRDLLGGRYTIGVWAWEVEEFPAAYGEAVDIVDEIWAISRFVRDAIARVSTKPVHVFPVPILADPEPRGPLDRDALGLPDGPMYLFAFDYLSVFERKNPLSLVDAYCAAFDESDPPFLAIKSINGDLCRTDRERLRAACARRSDIFLIEDYLPRQVVRSLMGDAACYVSLHRSEGFGLTMAEAMTLGVPVIATGYSGNLDFMTEDNSLLVPFDLVSVAAGSGPYPVTTRWAEPSVAAAAEHMRTIHDDPEFAAALGRRGQQSVLENARVERAAEFVRSRVGDAVQDLRNNPAKYAGKGLAASGGSALQRARMLIRSPLDVTTPSRIPFGLARRLRKAINRLLSHHDQQVNQRLEALADAVAVAVEISERQVGDLQDDSRARISELSLRLESTNARTELLDSEMAARPFMSHASQLVHRDIHGRERLELSGADGDVTTYKGFEDVFRGSEAFVADRLQPYLGLLRDKAPVLDVGCGRGELLGLLTAVGVPASGVDIDESMLARCRAKGLDVELGDAVELLDSKDKASLGAVTSFQVVEHIEPDQLRSLFEAAQRALRPGGLLVAETVNPHSPGALKTFWLDLTHIRPLYPEALLFLARESGFAQARIFFPMGDGDLDQDLRRCGEYALIATKE